MMRKKWCGILAGVAMMGSALGVRAASVSFIFEYGDFTGTGNGAVLGVLSLQAGNTDDDEQYGFSGWSQSSGVGGTLSGAGLSPNYSWSDSGTQVAKTTAASGYHARSVGELAALGIGASNLGLVFQVNQAGNQSQAANWLNVEEFNVVFINADGSLAFTATYTPSNAAAPGGSDFAAAGGTSDNGTFPGVGQGSSGWLFNVNLTSQDEKNFFNNANNMLGMQVTYENWMTNGTNGADNFIFAKGTQPPVIVPLPAAVWSGLSMLAALGVMSKLRRRARQV